MFSKLENILKEIEAVENRFNSAKDGNELNFLHSTKKDLLKLLAEEKLMVEARLLLPVKRKPKPKVKSNDSGE